MSQKNKRSRASQAPPVQQPPHEKAVSRRRIFFAAMAALLLAFVIGILLYKGSQTSAAQQKAASHLGLLASDHSPTLGKADAKVHIVEFLDPACETCAVFYPHIKRLLASNPDTLRLAVRHVPFHKGSDQVVRILEAARNQGKYWQALEAIFASQDQWAVNHAVQVDLVWRSIGGIGLDLDRIRNDMNDSEISRRIEKDLGDASALGVTKTPEFFVNGRPLPSFGLEELQRLVWEELHPAG